VPSDLQFGTRAPASGGGSTRPNQQFSAADFPFHQLSSVFNRESAVIYDTNDVFSSQGTFDGGFIRPAAGAAPPATPGVLDTNETCAQHYNPVLDANGTPINTATGNPYHTNNLIYRKVEPRQTPSVINAVFNVRQFWDGRANFSFNGVDPFGPRTYQPLANGVGNANAASTGIVAFDAASNSLRLTQPLIANSSLASQAVGPPLSNFEMSCSNKTFADLGRKLIGVQALARQKVHPDDSLFSRTPSLYGPAKGLNASYKALIQKAFSSKYWQSETKVVIANGAVQPDANGFTQMELNFSLFWGLAIQEYESLLISDNSPFDRGEFAMSRAAVDGMKVFSGKGQCTNCHTGPLLSSATVTSASARSAQSLQTIHSGDGANALFDQGFFNIGVRPTHEDLGVGATDPYGFDLSLSRQFKWRLLGQPNRAPDQINANLCALDVPLGPNCNAPTPANPGQAPRDAVDGAVKVPILRNVGLNPPYFHNGGQSNLRDVVLFYSRGGDRRGPDNADTTGFGPTPFGVTNPTNLNTRIKDIGLSDRDINNVVQFLLSLTDSRVACHSDVFDHPELPLPMGQQDVARPGTLVAQDIIATLPAVGRNGLATCFPNSGDLFGSLNPSDPRRLQDVVPAIVK